MKRLLYHTIQIIFAAVTLTLASCTESDEIMAEVEDGSIFYPSLNISASEMTMTEMSRADEAMSPDEEMYVKNLAIFEFDNEGLHDKRASTYHYINFLKGTVDGQIGVGDVDATEYGIVETTLKGLAFEQRSNGTICLVANVTEDEVKRFYEDYHEEGQSSSRISFDKFCEWRMPFKYIEADSGTYDETRAGHLENMYMFGYYQGGIDPAKTDTLRIDLGRLASRLDITIVNKTGKEIRKRLGYHFDNACSSAYFFPLKQGVPPNPGAGLTRTIICSGYMYDDNGNEIVDANGNPVVDEVENAKTKVPASFENEGRHTRYFYTAAHSANGWEDATKLHLFYNRRIVDDNVADTTSSVWIPLCNIHPSQAASKKNGYSLSRNTCYKFTINIKKIEEAAPVSPAPVSPALESTAPVSPDLKSTAPTRSRATETGTDGACAVRACAISKSRAAETGTDESKPQVVIDEQNPGEITVYLP